jgi:hypothetical protein
MYSSCNPAKPEILIIYMPPDCIRFYLGPYFPRAFGRLPISCDMLSPVLVYASEVGDIAPCQHDNICYWLRLAYI